MNRQYFAISGYWLDDKTTFENYIVTNFDDVDPEQEDTVFFYGLSETDIQKAIAGGEDTTLEFVITSYEEINL